MGIKYKNQDKYNELNQGLKDLIPFLKLKQGERNEH